MEKIRLKDGTEYEITSGASENQIHIPVLNSAEFSAVYETMTEDNLSKFEVLTEGGEVCAIIKDKYVTSARLEPQEVGFNAVFDLSTIDSNTKRIKALEDETATIKAENVELKELVDTLVVSALEV